MPAFSHFFLKRLSARSKFSSSWMMTSDNWFPPVLALAHQLSAMRQLSYAAP